MGDETMHYAFDEFPTLISRLPKQLTSRDPVVRYVCALVSELCYCHVPQFEIDNCKRAKVIPCSEYIEIVMTGDATTVVQYLRSLDLDNVFVLVDRGIVAIGIKVKDLLFIGFRGTEGLYDWRLNARASMVHMPSVPLVGSHGIRMFGIVGSYRAHRGFAEEALRVSAQIQDEMARIKMGSKDHLLLTGHSLGGAVAALAENFIGYQACSTIIFGTPRYCDIAGYFCSPLGPPTHIRRAEDIVPSVPPRRWGYADHPCQFDTGGNVMLEPTFSSTWSHFVWCTSLVLRKALRPHKIEYYRRELGKVANAQWSNEPFISDEKLK